MRNNGPSLGLRQILDIRQESDPRYAVDIQRLTAPATLPIRVADARAQLRIDDERLDGMIDLWLQGLTAHLEQITQRALITQRWQFFYSGFSNDMVLPMTPVVNIESITYLDRHGQRQTLDPSQYELVQNSVRTYLTLSSQSPLPQTGEVDRAVDITCQCGYGDDPSDVPASLRLYLMMRLVEQFDSASNGSAPAQTSFADYLLEPYRVLQAG